MSIGLFSQSRPAFLLVCVFFFNNLLGAFTGTGVLKIPYLAVVLPGKVDDVVIRLMTDAVSLNPNHIRPPYDLRAVIGHHTVKLVLCRQLMALVQIQMKFKNNIPNGNADFTAI